MLKILKNEKNPWGTTQNFFLQEVLRSTKIKVCNNYLKEFLYSHIYKKL